MAAVPAGRTFRIGDRVVSSGGLLATVEQVFSGYVRVAVDSDGSRRSWANDSIRPAPDDESLLAWRDRSGMVVQLGDVVRLPLAADHGMWERATVRELFVDGRRRRMLRVQSQRNGYNMGMVMAESVEVIQRRM